MKNKYAIMIFGTLLIFALDQITKVAMIARFKNRQSISLIDNFLAFTNVGNDGAAFGLFSGYNIAFFLTVNLIAVGFILYFFWTIESDRVMLAAGLSMILGGAFGNLMDRLRLGYVIDFIDVHHQFTWVSYNFLWPKFNVADSAILVGVFFFVIDFIRIEKQRQMLQFTQEAD